MGGIERLYQFNRETRFLTEREERNYREFFENRARGMVNIGNTDERGATREDFRQIGDARETASRGDVDGAIGKLKGIIGGGAEHTVLAKTYATIIACDVIQQSGNKRIGAEFISNFTEAIATEPEPYADLIMLGALKGRMLYWLTDDEENQPLLDEFDSNLLGQIDTREKEILKLGIDVNARVVSDMFDQGDLRMRLPVATIVSKESVTGMPSPGGGYPDSTMHLAEGRITSFAKLYEAVEKGMAIHSKQILERRIERYLYGVEFDKPQKDDEKKGKVIRQSKKNLVHVHTRALRRPIELLKDRFNKPEEFIDDYLKDYTAFGSLQYFLAVRLSRALEVKFKDIDRSLSPDKVEQRKMQIAVNTLDRLVQKATQDRKCMDGRERSVLQVALDEYRTSSGDNKYGIGEAEIGLKKQILATSLKFDGEYRIRDQEEITDVFKQHMWEDELTEDDKLEFARLILAVKIHYLDQLPDKIRQDVNLAIVRRAPFLEESVPQVLELMEKVKEEFVLRCETIRDKIDPQDDLTEEEQLVEEPTGFLEHLVTDSATS